MTAKVLFVHGYEPGHESSFVRQDARLLQQTYDVEMLSMYGMSLRQPIRYTQRLLAAVKRSDLVFGWFGGSCGPAVCAARLLGRPSIVVAGGADVVSLPEIGYGLSPTWGTLQRSRALTGLRLASRVLLFSDSSLRSFLELPGVDARRARRLYLGVDTDRFRQGGPRTRSVLTVSYVARVSLHRKGLLTYAGAARCSENIIYRFAGRVVEPEALQELRLASPANLRLLGALTDEELIAQYQQAMVYAQLSLHEGFGMALAESMACGCVPVVTNAGAIPEVVGDTGLYVAPNDPLAAAAAIQEVILGWSEVRSRYARERICDLFPLEKRRQGLGQAVEEILEHGK